MKTKQANIRYSFAVVAGNDQGLGISYSSLEQVGSLLPTQEFGAAKLTSYINVSTGNFMMCSPVFKQIERNFPVELYYFYNSQAVMSEAWRLAHKRFKKLPTKPLSQPYDKTAILLEADGHETTYTSAMDGSNIIWLAPACKTGTPYLRYDTTMSQWVWWDTKTHITEYYDGHGRLTQRVDAAGQATQYEYTDNQDSNRLTAVVGPSGTRYELRKENTSNGYQITLCVKKCGSNQFQVEQINYFDKTNRLTRTSIPLEPMQVWYYVDYKYNLNQVTSIAQSDGTSLTFGYDVSTPRRIASFQANDDHAITQLSYLLDNKTHLPKVILQDAQGGANVCYLDAQNRIVKVERSPGYFGIGKLQIPDTTVYARDEKERITSITHPNGGVETFSYAGLENLLASHTFPNGQKTDYAYDVIDKRHLCCCVARYDTQGQAYITRRVYDYHYHGKQVFLRFEISPEGWVTEYRPDGCGNIESVRHYLNHRFDLSGLLAIQAPTLSVMEQWIQDKLSGISLTEYVYDQERNAQVLLTYQYGQVNTEGQGDKDAPSTSQDKTIFDARGNLLQHSINQYAPNVAHPEAVTQQIFDGLNRLTSYRNPFNETTLHKYDGSNRQIIITQPNGRIEISHYSTGGLTIESQQQVDQQIRTETCQRNSMGSPLLTTLVDGNQVLTYYDKQFRLGFTVTQMGVITENRYDKQKRFNTYVSYAKTMDLEAYLHSTEPFFPTMFQLQDWMEKNHISDPQNDRYTYEFFDLSDRLIYTVDAERYVIQTIYDLLDSPIAKIAYHTPLAASDLAKLKNGESIQLPFDATKDRCIRTFYDRDGVVIGEQDARGYVTEYQRNGAGWVTHKILYATSKPVDLNVQDFNQVRPIADSTKDAHTYYFYNHRGLCEMEIDAEGYVTEKSYLAGGLLDKQIRHVRSLHETAPEWFNHPTIRPTREQLPTTTYEDAATQYTYDLLDREISALEANDNTRHGTTYNNMGRVLAQSQQDVTHSQAMTITGDTFRGAAQQYDAWEQIIQEANPFIAEKLQLVEVDPHLNPAQKTAARQKIWDQYSRRHTFDATGLKVKTLVSFATDKEFAQGISQDAATYYYYDQARRPIVLLTLLGNHQVRIQENTYNTFGEVISTRRYSQHNQALSPEIIARLAGGFLPAALRQTLNALQAPEDEVIQQMRDKRGLVTQKTDAEGYVSTYQYNAFKDCVQEQLPVANKQPSLTITHAFDTGGNEVETKQVALMELRSIKEITVKRAFNNFYGKQTNLIDAVGCQHKTAHDRLGRPIQQSTLADGVEVMDLRMELDAFARPRTQTDALNHKTQCSYDRPQRTTVIAHPEEGTQDTLQTNGFHETIKHTDGMGHSQRSQHAPDGQIAVSTNALNESRRASYNLAGWSVGHTTANGTLTESAYNPVGELTQTITDPSGLQLVETIQRNALGRAVSTSDARGTLTQQQFDRRGNVTEQLTDPTGLQLITQHQYNGQSTRIQTQQGDTKVPNQYQQTYQQDGLNRAIGDTVDPNGLAIHHQQQLNALGKVMVAIDPEGNPQRTVYNQRGQKRFTVDALGNVQEWRYDVVGNCLHARTYATALTEEQLSGLTDQTTPASLSAMLQPNVLDNVQQFFYDANNRECFTVAVVWNPQNNQLTGNIIEKRYNAASCEIEHIRYAHPIDATRIDTLTLRELSTLVHAQIDPLQDRHTHTVLDANNQKRFVIDAEGYVTEQRFTPTGKVHTKIGYGHAVTNLNDIDQLTPEAFYQRLVIDDTLDRYAYQLFDNLDRVVYRIHGKGNVTQLSYDENSNEIETYRFAATVVIPQAYQTLATAVKTLHRDPTEDRHIRKRVDKANRVIVVTDPCGHSDSYRLDAVGNATIHMDRRGFYWQTQFDRAKRPVKLIAPSTLVTPVNKQSDGTLKAGDAQGVAVVTRKTYDKNSQLIQQVIAEGLPDARTAQMHYNRNRQLSGTSLPNIPVDNGSPIVDIRYRPETLQTLQTHILYDTQKRKIGFCDEGGLWTFYVRNNQGKLIYKVMPGGAVTYKERNAFGEVIRQIKYAVVYPASHFLLPLREKVPVRADEGEMVADNFLNTSYPSWNDLNNFYQTHTSPDDRQTVYKRDRRGLLQQTSQGLVYDYETGLTNAANICQLGSVRLMAAIKNYRYNAFRQVVYQSLQINRHSQKETLTWYDLAGKPCVVAESMGIRNSESRFKIDSYQRNAFGEESHRCEYAQTLQQALTPETTLSMLQGWLATLASPKDRQFSFAYYQTGKLKSRSRLNVIRQQVTWQPGTAMTASVISDVTYAALVESYLYDPTENRIAVIREDGRPEYRYYNPQNILIAQTKVPRNNLGLTGELIPLTTFGVSAHGQTVATWRHLKGTSKVALMELRSIKEITLPQPLGTDPSDQLELVLFDARGKQQIHQKKLSQDNVGYPQATSYTANGRLAREWMAVTTWVQDINDPKKFEWRQLHIDIKSLTYDAFNYPNSVQLIRDSEVKQATYTVNNVFGEAIQEGDSPTNYAIYRQFDTLGRIWLSNMTGIDTLYFYNLLNAEILKIDSSTKAAILRSLTYAQVPDVLDWSVSDAEHTEKQRDLQNQIRTVTFPAGYIDDQNAIKSIPLNLYVSRLYPELGAVSVSWPVVQEKTVTPIFYYWVSGRTVSQAPTLPIKTTTDGLRSGVDVSALATDRYQYRIDYQFTAPQHDPNQPKQTIIQYQSLGEFQVSTGHVANSQHCIPIVSGNGMVEFVGKTTGLTQVEVWQDGIKVGDTLTVSNNRIDLSAYPSGVYQFKSLFTSPNFLLPLWEKVAEGRMRGDQGTESEQSLSLPASVLTNTPPQPDQTPMAHEVPVSGVNLRLQTDSENESTQGTLYWTVPALYANNTVQLVCVYKARPAANAPLARYREIFYFDKNTNVFTFERPVERLQTISLAICLSNAALIERSDIKEKEGNDTSDYLTLYQDEPGVLSEGSQTSYAWPSKMILYITPWFNLSQAPQLSYLNTNQDRRAERVLLQSTGYTSEGFTLDVTGFSPGYYPFLIKKVDFPSPLTAMTLFPLPLAGEGGRRPGEGRPGERRHQLNSPLEQKGVFELLQGGQAFPGDFDELSKDHQHLVQPSHGYGYDRWHNPTSKVDSLGHTTDTQYNDINKPTERLEPPIDIVNSDGSVTPNFRSRTAWGYDLLGAFIGESRWNMEVIEKVLQLVIHTYAQINDGVNVIYDVLADGTVERTNQFDSFNRVANRKDSRGNVWVLEYDGVNNVVSLTSPKGNKSAWQFDEKNQMVGYTNPDGHMWRYSPDIAGNIEESYQPLGNRTTRYFDHNRQILQQINPNRSTRPNECTLTWVRDYFGQALKHIDLGGGVLTYELDGKLQLIKLTRSGGYVGRYTQLVSKVISRPVYNEDGEIVTYTSQTTYEPSYLQPPAEKNQHIEYRWSLGRCVEMIDYVRGLVSQYGVDVEGRRQSILMKQLSDGRILRQVKSKLNAKGAESYAQDNQAICETSYDGLNNRRKVQLTLLNAQGGVLMSQATWWDYDAVCRVTVCGVIRDKQIKPNPGIGFTLRYEAGLRKAEVKYLSDGSREGVALEYDADGRLETSCYDNGEVITRWYSKSGSLNFYRSQMLNQPPSSIRTLQEDANGNLVRDEQSFISGALVTTTYKVSVMDIIWQQVTDYHEGDTVDTFTYGFAPKETYRITGVVGNRHNDNGDNSSTSLIYEGPNGEMNAVIGGSNGSGGSEDRYFMATPEGLVLERSILTKNRGIIYQPWKQQIHGMRLFYTVNGSAMAGYSYVWDSESTKSTQLLLQTDLLKVGNLSNHYWGSQKANGLVSSDNHAIFQGGSIYTPVRPQSFADSRLGQNDWQAVRWRYDGDNYGYASYGYTDNVGSGSLYTVVSGDSYEKIAQKVFEDSQLASSIADANGGQSLSPGDTIRIPQLMPSHNGPGTSLPYAILLNTLQGNILPHLETPQPKQSDHFWEELLEIVTVAISVVLAIPTGGTSLAAWLNVTSMIGKAVLTGAVAGIFDASLQGVLIGVGLQKYFSASQVVEAAFTAGGMSWANSGEKFMLKQAIADKMLKLGAVNVAEQLSLMAIGQQKQFDIVQVGNVMLSAGVNARLDGMKLPDFFKDDVVGSNLLRTVSGSVIASALKGQVGFEQMAAQLIGNQLVGGTKHYLMDGMSWVDEHLFQDHVSSSPSMATYQASSPSVKTKPKMSSSSLDGAKRHQGSGFTKPFYDDPLLDTDFHQLLDPRIKSDDPRWSNLSSKSSQVFFKPGPAERAFRATHWKPRMLEAAILEATSDKLPREHSKVLIDTYHRLQTLEPWGSAIIERMHEIGKKFAPGYTGLEKELWQTSMEWRKELQETSKHFLSMRAVQEWNRQKASLAGMLNVAAKYERKSFLMQSLKWAGPVGLVAEIGVGAIDIMNTDSPQRVRKGFQVVGEIGGGFFGVGVATVEVSLLEAASPVVGTISAIPIYATNIAFFSVGGKDKMENFYETHFKEKNVIQFIK